MAAVGRFEWECNYSLSTDDFGVFDTTLCTVTNADKTPIFICTLSNDCYRLFPDRGKLESHRVKDHDVQDANIWEKTITWNSVRRQHIANDALWDDLPEIVVEDVLPVDEVLPNSADDETTAIKAEVSIIDSADATQTITENAAMKEPTVDVGDAMVIDFSSDEEGDGARIDLESGHVHDDARMDEVVEPIERFLDVHHETRFNSDSDSSILHPPTISHNSTTASAEDLPDPSRESDASVSTARLNKSPTQLMDDFEIPGLNFN